jgi:nicotinamidase-related amidase
VKARVAAKGGVTGVCRMLMRAEQSFLLIVDVQEKLAPAVLAPDAAIANIATLVKAAERLGIPRLASEQYPKGLGRTVPALAALLPAGAVHAKVHFSCLGEPGWPERLKSLGRRQAIVCGVETHVCVLQSALELKAAGYDTFVVADAAASRRAESHRLGLDRLQSAGVFIVTTEMVAFEWLQRAGTAEFRDLLALIK